VDTQTNSGHKSQGISGEAKGSGVSKGSGGFAGSVLALSGGAVVAQALSIAAAPVVSRLFAPEAFGVAAVFASLVALVLGAGCLRYELAIPLPKSDADAANVFGLCCLVVLGITGLAALAVGLLGPGLLRLLGAAELAPCCWLLPVGVFLIGMAMPLRYWNTRHGQFKRLASIRVLAALVGVSATLAMGVSGLQSGDHLVLGRIAALAATFGLLGWSCWRSDIGFVLRHCSAGGMRRLARRYAKFPLVSSWSSFLNVASKNIAVIMLLAFFGTTVVGFYGRAYLLVMLPIALIGRSIGQVFFQRAAAQRAAGRDLSRLVEGVSRRLICVSALPALVLALIGPDIFVVICGARWAEAGAEAGVYARILSPLLFVVGVCSPMSTLVCVLERQEVGLAVTGFLFLSRLVALVVGGSLIGDARWALALFSVAGVAGYGVLYFYLLSTTGVSGRRMAARVARHITYALPTLAAGAIAKWAMALPSWQVVTVVGTMSLSYWPLALRGDGVAVSLLHRATGNVRAALRMARSG
jgi:O-antigen/teichoic acid export membrane protein